jgi:hypothetical protein
MTGRDDQPTLTLTMPDGVELAVSFDRWDQHRTRWHWSLGIPSHGILDTGDDLAHGQGCDYFAALDTLAAFIESDSAHIFPNLHRAGLDLDRVGSDVRSIVDKDYHQ